MAASTSLALGSLIVAVIALILGASANRRAVHLQAQSNQFQERLVTIEEARRRDETGLTFSVTWNARRSAMVVTNRGQVAYDIVRFTVENPDGPVNRVEEKLEPVPIGKPLLLKAVRNTRVRSGIVFLRMEADASGETWRSVVEVKVVGQATLSLPPP
jgi:hypothetical protein